LEKFGAYIRENPMKAGLKPGDYRVGFGANVGQASRLPRERFSASVGTLPSAPVSRATGAGGTPALLYFARRVGGEETTQLRLGLPSITNAR
jgi:hypothetical protein